MRSHPDSYREYFLSFAPKVIFNQNSLLVVGDCFAANLPHEHATTAACGFMHKRIFLGTPARAQNIIFNNEERIVAGRTLPTQEVTAAGFINNSMNYSGYW